MSTDRRRGQSGGNDEDRPAPSAVDADLEADDFVESLLAAVDASVTEQFEAGELSNPEPEQSAPEASATEPTTPPRPRPVRPQTAPVPPAPVRRHIARQSGQHEAVRADRPRPRPQVDRITEVKHESTMPVGEDWQGPTPTFEVVAKPEPSPHDEEIAPLRAMYEAEPRFVMAAGALLVIGLVCLVVGVVVLS